jgi:hypothetical protein
LPAAGPENLKKVFPAFSRKGYNENVDVTLLFPFRTLLCDAGTAGVMIP